MKKLYLVIFSFLFFYGSYAQRLLTWAPEFANATGGISITVDCNKGNQGLLNYEGGNSNNVYVHIGVITNLSSGAGDWKHVLFTWGTTNPAAKATPLGANKYQYNIANLNSFFGITPGETIQKIAIIFRNGTGSQKQVNSDGSDMYIPVYSNAFAVRFNLPPFEPRYIPWLEPINATVGQSITVTGVSSANADLSLSLNGNVFGSATNNSGISANATISTACDQKIILTGTMGGNTVKDSFSFNVAQATVVAPLPPGVQDGINYNADQTSVTLVLFAPLKNSAVVIGDFSNWQVTCANQMKRTPDGNRYFITLTGLTPGTLYKYQYVVDDTLKIADPYTELILDPNNDQYIPAATFPSLPAYPTGLTTGIVSTFQIAAPVYNWSNNSYSRPDKKNLLIYELLVRDFLAAGNWQTLTDTLNYLKNLGVNAIEVMPFNEFEGNSSWGYNPDFFFAPDKAYGTKNNLKRFIDSAHSKGMAVIMDAVLNQATGLSPLAQLWWNNTNNTPAANSPFFNVTATHPFSVFNDFNHESEATKYMVSRFIRHWLSEYKLDGFRWDLSKGFTQHVTTSVAAWNAYDPSRVAIWQRYYDSTQAVSAGSYCILEHLGNDDEESDLATRGMLLWGKMTDPYNQNTMGYSSSSDISRAFYKNRPGWTQPHLVTYAESHDEERIMYKNLTFGNSANPAHDVKNLQVALARTEAMMPFLFLVPGPKMIWEFGELGYDKSIFMCEDGTVPAPYGNDQCKLSPKPPLWNYVAETGRKKIYDVIAGLTLLRKQYPNTFLSNTISGNLGNDLKKSLIISNSEQSVVALANFEVTAQDLTVTFPAAGTWYNYFSTETISATGSAQTIHLNPGEYRVYVNHIACSTPAPNATGTVTYCQNASATALTATGNALLWYSTATGGTGSTTAPIPSTSAVGTTTYYVSQTLNGCEGPRTAIVVTIISTPPAPTVNSPVTYCQNATASALTATGTNLLWYTSATGGSGSSSAPIPPTNVIGSSNYYVSQTTGSCESPRAIITVTITTSTVAPTVSSPVVYCQGATATQLTATGSNLLWYTAATGGTGSTTAPTPSTSNPGNTSYYVSQTQSCGESPRAQIVVQVNAIPAAPAVTSPVSYCQNTTANALTATGTNLLWYTAATGGTGNTTSPIPNTSTAGSFNYYVSQTNGGCESPRAMITVQINATPPAPTVTTPVTYCQNATATALTAAGNNLLWYNSQTGGTGSSTAPIPVTTNAGSYLFYVSQTTGTCESQRAVITVIINPLPDAPGVSAAVSYCQNATAIPLSATGNNIIWYTTATGGTGTSAAPTPLTTTAGTFHFYASQTNTCGESPRAAITVTVIPTPALPAALSATQVSMQGATLSWSGQPGNYYTVEYKKSTDANWITWASNITETSIEINGLGMGITYDWRVSANCNATNSGQYSNSSFTTDDRNQTITHIKNGIGIKLSPNPVYNTGVIDYSLSQTGIVNIHILDANGKLVKKLYEELQAAGQYSFSFQKQLSNLAAGVYFIRISQNKKQNSLPFIKKL